LSPPQPPSKTSGEKNLSSNGPTTYQDDQSEIPSSINLSLPSGAVLNETMLGVPDNWQTELFPEDRRLFYYVAKYPNGDIQGVFGLFVPKSAYKTFSNAKLQGAAATLYTDGNLQTLAFYTTGDRNGPLKLWNEKGQRLLYAQYKYSKKHGIACFFQKGMPWLAQEWDKGQLANEYLVKWANKGPRILTAAEVTGDQQTEFSKARDEVHDLYATIDANEKALKNNLAKWCHDQDQEARKRNFTVQAPGRRARASATIAAHNAENAAANESVWRTALRNSTSH
jgi:hypothetical protein